VRTKFEFDFATKAGAGSGHRTADGFLPEPAALLARVVGKAFQVYRVDDTEADIREGQDFRSCGTTGPPRGSVTLTVVASDALAPGSFMTMTATPAAAAGRCTWCGTGRRRTSPDQVLMRRGEVVIDQKCGGAVDNWVQYRHLPTATHLFPQSHTTEKGGDSSPGVDSTAIILRGIHEPNSRDFDLRELAILTVRTPATNGRPPGATAAYRRCAITRCPDAERQHC
jgi:hypothetical protein